MASEKPKTQSNEGQDEPTTDSVFDFLYHDAPRIASFLSQFDKSGHLTEVVTGERAQRSKQSANTIEAGGGAPPFASASGSHTRDVGAEYEKDIRRVFDPAWTNARAFLDYLSERDLIQRDIAAAGIGQFVLCSGALRIADLQLVEKTWRMPSVQKAMEAGLPQPKNNAERRRLENDVASPQHAMKLFLDMISILPHTIQATIDGSVEVWCSLDQSAMTVSTSDIVLKHGQHIPGDWNALAILDARPDNDAAADPVPQLGDPDEMATKLMSLISPIARTLLGRPRRCYGVTPLLLFRQVAG